MRKTLQEIYEEQGQIFPFYMITSGKNIHKIVKRTSLGYWRSHLWMPSSKRWDDYVESWRGHRFEFCSIANPEKKKYKSLNELWAEAYNQFPFYVGDSICGVEHIWRIESCNIGLFKFSKWVKKESCWKLDGLRWNGSVECYMVSNPEKPGSSIISKLMPLKKEKDLTCNCKTDYQSRIIPGQGLHETACDYYKRYEKLSN